MKAIPKPTIKVREVFTTCISTVHNSLEKQQLTDCIDIIDNAERDFENKFPSNNIYQIESKLAVSKNIGKTEMGKVYDYRMVRSGMPGNKYYNQIKLSAPYGKCPLCSVRLVDTLDHYLPKAKYPIYSVTPINLIPACTPCNKGKGIEFPTTSEEQTLHPYYDNIENESWLKAKVLKTNPIGFEFYVSPPSNWTQVLKDRTANHFIAFNLNELFTSHANEELRGSKKQFLNLFNSDPNLLRAHLRDSYESRLELGINSWQAVFYNTLFSDDWFCNEGITL